MDPTDGLSQGNDEGSGPTDRKASPLQRAEPNNVPGSSLKRPPQEHRRKRTIQQRYAGWGDGIERAYCARAQQLLPETFPVASHSSATTIPATIVARRPESFLLCTFSHHGPHLWPDGELVEDGPATVSATREVP